MPAPIDLTGHTYGRLTVIERGPNKGRSRAWRCRCSCGKEAICRVGDIRSGAVKSCGCLNDEQRRKPKNRPKMTREEQLKSGREARRVYYERNREKVLARNRATRAAAWSDPIKREEMRERTRRWAGKNADRIRANSSNRRARLRGAAGSYTHKDVQEIHRLQCGKCAACRCSLKKGYEVDHIVPVSRGGSNSRKNIQLLCVRCNRSKWARDPIEYMQSLGMLV